MRTSLLLLPAIALLSACGSLRETAQVRDDVYDIPDRNALAAAASASKAPEEQQGTDDYYNPTEAARYQQGSYWDQAYNDPRWYNRDRFGFGYGGNNGWGNSNWGTSNWGSGYGSYGMGGCGNGGYYDPYYMNSWQSGYGAWGNSGWNSGGFYQPWGQGGGCGCCGMGSSGFGYNPYGNGMYGNSYGYNPYGYNSYGYGSYGYGGYGGYGSCPGGSGGNTDGSTSSFVVRHRPSMNGGGTGSGGYRGPRGSRQVSLLAPPPQVRVHRTPNSPRTEPTRDVFQVPARTDRTTHRPGRDRVTLPRKDGGGSHSGRGNGGGSMPSPSPGPSPAPAPRHR
jgi:hypothetical protein